MCANGHNKPYTIKTHIHKSFGFIIYSVSRINREYFKPICYRANSEKDLEKFQRGYLKSYQKFLNSFLKYLF